MTRSSWSGGLIRLPAQGAHDGVSADTRRLVLAAGLIAFAAVIVRTAWLDDDAYITFRTVDNFLNGYGLRWNVAHRVQAYTHPLWMLLVTSVVAVTREFFFTVLALSAVISVGVAALVASRIAGGVPSIVFAFSALGLSKAFVDYSTSGLENPLTHLLLVAFCLLLFRPVMSPGVLLRLSCVASLLMLNRLDTALLVLPALAVAASRVGVPAAWRPLVLGSIPLVAWEVFSLIYYGFAFPNTAYSKLQHGVPAGELFQQGMLYLLDSLAHDPLTLIVIATAVTVSWTRGSGRTVTSGIVLYVSWVVSIGGDFMSGRFLTAPFLLAVITLVRLPMPSFAGTGGVALALLWVLGLGAPRPTILSDATYGSGIDPAEAVAPTGITDERLFYYPASGLLTARRGLAMPDHKWRHMGVELRQEGATFFATDAAGFIGYAAGPQVHLLDKYGLPDPLLARLPAATPWRIGHFERAVPEGYKETIQSGENRIADSGVAAYYEKLRIITEDPLWSWERFGTILRMNLGHYDHYLWSYAENRRAENRRAAEGAAEADAGDPDSR